MRSILAAGRLDENPTRSPLERRFLAFLEAAGVPRPAVNVWMELRPGQWIESDCVWRAQRLIAELDGREDHDTRRAFESDRARDVALQAAGWRVVRITARALKQDPAPLAADLSRLLGEPAA